MNCTKCNEPNPPHELNQGLCFGCTARELSKWQADMREVTERNERLEMALKKIAEMPVINGFRLDALIKCKAVAGEALNQ